jgi:hypothetical protein
MTAERQPPDPLEEIAPALGSATPLSVALLVVALAAAGGWLHTVHELNRLVSRELVPGDALRELRALEQQRRPAAPPRRAGADD